MDELQGYAATQVNLGNLSLRGEKEKQVTEEYIELFIPLHEVQKQSKQMVCRHYGINSQRQKEGRTEVGIMVSSRGGWIWGGTHRASRALVNVLFLTLVINIQYFIKMFLKIEKVGDMGAGAGTANWGRRPGWSAWVSSPISWKAGAWPHVSGEGGTHRLRPKQPGGIVDSSALF